MGEREIFDAALAIDDLVARAAYLDRVCAGNAALREHLVGLLAMQGQLGSFLEAPASPLVAAVGEPPSCEGPGTLIGPYKLLEQIGEGGFGTVWMAEQQQPVRRKVALKVLKAGMDTMQVVARFEAERQALAIMDHPNIATVLDGGATPSGRPYFVMELVKGFPLTDFCDRHRLTPRQRLELFVGVCQAVQHAHQKGIIHRDLKPSNVLVTVHDTVPVVKVIDFGVAKALGQELTDKTLFTGFAQMLGTPLYMSPEQAGQSGLDIDTRTDVYALGVLLYELLTGTTSFDKERLKTAGFDEIRRIIREEEPAKPSTRISTLGQAAATMSDNRKSDPRRLSQLCRGELDWIVMKALEKDRNRRYESASAFAADVRRYLGDEPVQAGPPSAWYRFRKFARRNKVVLATVAVLGLAALGLLSGVFYHNAVLRRAVQAADAATQTAQEKKRLARQAVDEMYTEVADKWFALEPRLKDVQRRFLLKALHFYQELAKEEGDDPSVRTDTARAYERIGNIHTMLGDLEQTVKDYSKALEIRQKLADDFPNEPEHRQYVGTLTDSIGIQLERLGRFPEAEAAYRKGLELRQRLADEFPSTGEYRWGLSFSHNNLSVLLRRTGRLKQAEEGFRQAVELCRPLPDEKPIAPHYQLHRARAQGNLAGSLSDAGHRKEAEQLYRGAENLLQQLADKFPAEPEYRFMLARTRNNHGKLQEDLGQPREAEQLLGAARELLERLVADFPMIPEYRQTLAHNCTFLGNLLERTDRRAEAEPPLRRACDLLRKLVADSPHVLDYREKLAGSHYSLALLCVHTGRPALGEQAYSEAVEVYQQLVDGSPKVPHYQNMLGGSLNNLARLVRDRGELSAAKLLLEQAIVYQQNALKLTPGHNRYRFFLRNHYQNLADTLVRMGTHAEAARAAEEVVRAWPEDVWSPFIAAGFFSRCVPLAEPDVALAETYAARAVTLLQQAVKQGYDNPEKLRKDADWKPLRTRADFQQVISDLEARSKPKQSP